MLWIWMDLLDSLDLQCLCGGAFQPFRWRWRWMTLGLILDWNWYHDFISLYQSGSFWVVCFQGTYIAAVACPFQICDLRLFSFMRQGLHPEIWSWYSKGRLRCAVLPADMWAVHVLGQFRTQLSGGVVYCERTRHPLQFWLHMACCHMQVANEAYKGNIGRTNEQCCDQTCSAVKCPEGKKACTHLHTMLYIVWHFVEPTSHTRTPHKGLVA